jgi:hypothetical protein
MAVCIFVILFSGVMAREKILLCFLTAGLKLKIMVMAVVRSERGGH